MSLRRAMVALLVSGFSVPARAHTTPPVVLASERATISALLDGARRAAAREVRLTKAQQEALRSRCGWTPPRDSVRWFVGRVEEQDAGAVLFLTEATVHGPIRVGVGFAPDGSIHGVRITEASEESYGWVKRLVDSGWLRSFAGRDGRAPSPPPPANASSMVRFYGAIVARLVERAAALYDVTLR